MCYALKNFLRAFMSDVIAVPLGMSYVNVFRALWENSKPSSLFLHSRQELKRHEETVSTSEKVVEFFKKLYGTYVDYAGGRLIQADFRNFPELRSRGYDQKYGAGAAYRALQSYNKIPRFQRFDRNDRKRFSDLSKKLVSKL